MKNKFCVHDMSDITSNFCIMSFCNISYILFSHAYVLSSYTIYRVVKPRKKASHPQHAVMVCSTKILSSKKVAYFWKVYSPSINYAH